MFLFLHDLGATPSLWIPVIRSLLGEKSGQYSDVWLKDNFTLPLPGHVDQDKKIEMADIYADILKFQTEKLQAQNELANQLLLNNTHSFISSLKSKKLVLIGHSFGALVALNFTTNYIKQVEKISLISLGTRFSKIGMFLKNMEFKRLNSKKRHELQAEIEATENLRHKILVSHFLEKPNRKAYKSGLEIMKKYNFKKLFKKLSINQQIGLATLPILAIGGKLDRLTRYSSIQELEYILENDSPDEFPEEEKEEKPPQTIIISQPAKSAEIKKEEDNKVKTDFKIILYNNSDHSPMDKYFNEVAVDLKKFLEKGEKPNLNSINIDKRKDIIF